MNYRKLGKSGLLVSELSFGAWVTFGNQVDNSIAEECMKIAYDDGINFFDNAETYAQGRAETVMGEILQKFKWDRTSYVLSSKVYFGSGGKLPNQTGLSRKHIFEGFEASVKRLQVDYLDLFFCHRPDENTPIEETVRAMTDLVNQGKIFYWGTSEWSAQQIMEAYSIARQYNLVPPTMEQPQYNMFERFKVETDYRRLYEEIGLGTTIWSPLASGLLTGKYNEGSIPKGSRAEAEPWLADRLVGEKAKPRVEKVKKLMNLAENLGISIIELAIAWCLKNPNVSTVILGASKSEQLRENLKAADKVGLLTDEVMIDIDQILA